MLWAIYQVLFTVGFAVLVPGHVVRMIRRGGYRCRFGERLARYRPDVLAELRAADRRVWVHAVSVGEMQVAMNVIAEWRRREPVRRFVISTTTPTGRSVAERRMVPGDTVLYSPVDFPWVIRRALNTARPEALVLCESELWPNWIRAVCSRGRPVVVVNGRLSDRSFPRYRRWARPMTLRVLPMLRHVCAQSAEDRRRFIELGASPDRVEVVGSAKYDATPPDPAATDAIRRELIAAGFPADAVWLVGGSTWPGEEVALLGTFRECRQREPRLRLILVPRHAERGAALAAKIQRLGFSLYRRSNGSRSAGAPDVALFDTTGELGAVYGLADVVFVGKSLTARGGQNPIEPALCGRPIVCGPHMENFRAILEDFSEQNAIRIVADSVELSRGVAEWLADPSARKAAGERALEVVRQKAGAIRRTVDALQHILGEHREMEGGSAPAVSA